MSLCLRCRFAALFAVIAVGASTSSAQPPTDEPALPVPAPIVSNPLPEIEQPTTPIDECPQPAAVDGKPDSGKSDKDGKKEKDDGKTDKGEKKDKADDDKKKKEDEEKKKLADSLHQDDCYGFKSLFDSLRPPVESGKKWYEKFSIRGYVQTRFGRTVDEDPFGADPSLFNDRSINGVAENFSIRRARLILFGDVSDHLYFYMQPDFASTPAGIQTSTFFGQLRDLYGDVYIDKEKVHRFRVGLSKVPYGFENMQSSQNRVPLDRTDSLNTATPTERDLGVFYYWTPEREQKLLKELVDGGLKGSGNYGVIGFGVYNGQGGAQFEQNLNLHTVGRVTYPYRLPSGQVVEASIQGYTGDFVVEGAPIRPLGMGPATTPAGTRATGEQSGQLDQRVAGTFVYYPQPFGFQAEWNVGNSPGLNDAQTAVVTRSLTGGYGMFMYKFDTGRCDAWCPGWGIIIPYARYQYYRGGYKSIPNAPYGTHSELNLGVEWQIRKEMELVTEYSFVDGVNLTAINQPSVVPYRNFDGGVLRFQFQINY